MAEDYDPVEDMRRCAKVLVDHEIKSGSNKTEAHKRVSRLTGIPPRSIGRIIDGSSKEVSFVQFRSIMNAFLAHTSRIVEATANDFLASRHTMDPDVATSLEAEIEAMRDKINAAKKRI